MRALLSRNYAGSGRERARASVEALPAVRTRKSPSAAPGRRERRSALTRTVVATAPLLYHATDPLRSFPCCCVFVRFSRERRSYRTTGRSPAVWGFMLQCLLRAIMDPATFDVCEDYSVLLEVSVLFHCRCWRYEQLLWQSFFLSITEQQTSETFDVPSLVELVVVQLCTTTSRRS